MFGRSLTNYVRGIDNTVVVLGGLVGPSDVTWLNTAINVVVLPLPQNLQVIKSISLNELKLMFTPDTACRYEHEYR
jgi:hypothetical protein